MLAFELKRLLNLNLAIFLVQKRLNSLPKAKRDILSVIGTPVRVADHVDSDPFFFEKELGGDEEGEFVFVVVALESEFDLLVVSIWVENSFSGFE